MSSLTPQAQSYARLTPTSAPAVWTVDLSKHGATWSWFTTNEVGGGFGTNAVTSQQDALARSLGNVPDNTPVRVVVDDVERGTYVKVPR